MPRHEKTGSFFSMLAGKFSSALNSAKEARKIGVFKMQNEL